ncbi:carbohydrate sulfotransferase 5-like [Montipora capricornis]|uniref:carbohydrate sulfotransferase 5-like n=1 Tax=Montipora capricornis TaxID=246305 RepID=UPI0035F1660A
MRLSRMLPLLLFCSVATNLIFLFSCYHQSMHKAIRYAKVERINYFNNTLLGGMNPSKRLERKKHERKKSLYVEKTSTSIQSVNGNPVELGSKVLRSSSRKYGKNNKEGTQLRQKLHLRKNVIILSPGRGGSSFLGSLFDKNPNIMYCFEPLYPSYMNTTGSHWKEKTYERTSLEVINGLLQCDFNNISERAFSMFTKSPFHQSKSRALSKENLTGFSKSKLYDICNNYKYTVLKILAHRLPEKSILSLEELFQKKNYLVKIVHLVRDPRSVVYSMVKVGWIKNHSDPSFNRDVTRLCNPMLKNLRLASLTPPPWLKNRFQIIRYEDLAFNTKKITRELYKFAEFDWSSEIYEWINTLNDNKKQEDAYSLYRNASASIDLWKNAPKPMLRTVESICGDLINFLGYPNVNETRFAMKE